MSAVHIPPPKYKLKQRLIYVGGDHSLVQVTAIEQRIAVFRSEKGTDVKVLVTYYSCVRLEDNSAIPDIAERYLAVT